MHFFLFQPFLYAILQLTQECVNSSTNEITRWRAGEKNKHGGTWKCESCYWRKRFPTNIVGKNKKHLTRQQQVFGTLTNPRLYPCLHSVKSYHTAHIWFLLGLRSYRKDKQPPHLQSKTNLCLIFMTAKNKSNLLNMARVFSSLNSLSKEGKKASECRWIISLTLTRIQLRNNSCIYCRCCGTRKKKKIHVSWAS